MCPLGIYVPRSLHQKGSERLPEHKLGKIGFKDTEGVALDWLLLLQCHPVQAVTVLALRFGKDQGGLHRSSNAAGC